MKRKRNIDTSQAVSTGSLLTRLGVLFGLFFVLMIVLSFIMPLIQSIGFSPRTEGLWIAFFQAVFVFITPSFIYSRIFSFSPAEGLGLNVLPDFQQIIGLILAFVIGMPMLNQIIFWNESIVFPNAMTGLETVLKDLEQQAVKSTETLLSTTSWGGLISGILIIGILTGIAEEVFFRGALQKGLILSHIGHHKAIWITAFIFSAMHFQFYGFIPRLLLGAFFGYLFWWSGSLWVSIIAHALNNSLVVMTVWMVKNNIISENIEELGVAQESFPWIGLISMVLLIIFFYFFRRLFEDKTHPYQLR